MAIDDRSAFQQKLNAINSLKPGAEWSLVDNGALNWIDKIQTEPTEQEIADEIVRLQAVYDGNAYQRTRAPLYAELKEQLDQLYHDMAADKGDKTGEWFKAIKKVKDDNPKG